MTIDYTLLIRTENVRDDLFEEILSHKFKKLTFTKWGGFEPLNKEFDDRTARNVLSLFLNEQEVILKGKNKFFLKASSGRNGVSIFSGEIRTGKDENKTMGELQELVKIFAKGDQLLFGYFCTEDEYDLIHRVRTEYSVGWRGVSFDDFSEFLPGVHWFTVFGSKLVETIGKEKFESLEDVDFLDDLEDGSIGFSLKSSIDDLECRVEEIKEIERELGADFFFGKEKEAGSYAHHEDYKAYLSEFSRGY